MVTVQPTLNYVTLMLFVKHWKTAMAAFVTMDTLETEKYALVSRSFNVISMKTNEREPYI